MAGGRWSALRRDRDRQTNRGSLPIGVNGGAHERALTAEARGLNAVKESGEQRKVEPWH